MAIFKSTDAGKSFQFAGLEDAGQVGGIRVHPTNPDIVWARGVGTPFGPSDERGIFKTRDGGTTWKKTLFVDNEHGGRDIEVDWQNPDVLYAAMYRGFRKGWDIISGGPADKGGIYKSVDGGETWKKMSAGLPSKLIGKIDLDIARSNPKVLYAMIEAPGNEGGLFRSNDAGESWTLVNSSQRLRAGPSTSTTSASTRRTRTRSGSASSASTSRATAARRSPASRRRTATTTASGSTPTTPTS